MTGAIDASSASSGWISDFSVQNGHLLVHKTGARLKLNITLLSECALWLVYFLLISLYALALYAGRKPRATIWFAPDIPRPWYLVRAAMIWGGIGVARSAQQADAAFYFDDSTIGARITPSLTKAFNFACTDVSKSQVTRIFEEVFGYPLAVDAATWVGPAVEKSETNGVHDGRIVQCPCIPCPGKVYQYLIDTAIGQTSQDLRTPCVGGRPVTVWVKHKPAAHRFSIHNLSVDMRDPQTIYTPDELSLIHRFCARMGLDWGGLDILRDSDSGRIYIVDVNKTDVGPVIALSWIAKIRSTALLSNALLALIAPSALHIARHHEART